MELRPFVDDGLLTSHKTNIVPPREQRTCLLIGQLLNFVLEVVHRLIAPELNETYYRFEELTASSPSIRETHHSTKQGLRHHLQLNRAKRFAVQGHVYRHLGSLHRNSGKKRRNALADHGL
ncbi:hypothetical protein AVEN_71609-1 [Araneus ventricosus]|uniref:Uncharacterized protein n=1 Tax=Araneus ventricosus TaxID=182803 RepID=A0A4Y2JJX0_ARAVE|nr:hypothetical protein AVEN_71609-1 [Araneus ventricosus]